ncbi:hypothetical protein QQG55_30630 [Brugia pahangi]
MKNPISEYIANFPQNSNNIKNLWKESENAQKRAQAEYKVIRELADEIFDQAKKVFSAATGGYSGNGYDLNPFQSMNDKFHKQSDRHKILKNEKQKLKSGKVVRNYEKWHNDMIGHWIKKHLPKEPRNIDTSYELFGVLPKFDPRFPFDRAFKLMDDLQPPDMFKFSTNNFHI